MPTRKSIRELLEDRAALITEARAIIEQAESRDLTSEEEARHSQILDDADALKRRIDAETRQLEAERAAAATVAPREPDRGSEDRGSESAAERRARLQGVAFRSFLSGNLHAAPPDALEEFRALQADIDTAGGYITAPPEFVDMLIGNIDDQVFVRRLATGYQLPMAASLGVPTRDADVDDADWTSELETGAEDTGLAFGMRELRPHPLAKRIRVSRTLIRQATIGVEALVGQRLGYKFAVALENAYLTGSGQQQPLGVFTASADGISTGRDVSTGNTTTAPTFDGLKEAKYTLKGAYWAGARWMFHRDVVKIIDKLKDGDGQYIWQPSVVVGQPDRLLNLPLDMSEFAPNTLTTGSYVGILGDWSHYWIADALGFQIQRLDELYAESNRVGFIGRAESDGAPVLEEAFVRVTLA